jgi:hypothetical protein
MLDEAVTTPWRRQDGADSPGAAFRLGIDRLRDHYVALWHDTPESLPNRRAFLGWRRRRANAREARDLIDDLATEVQSCPEDPDARNAWRDRVKARVRAVGERSFGWPQGYRQLMFDSEFEQSTVTFVREAKRFDEKLAVDDLFQALRNVWIANSIQMLLDLPVECTPAVFSYSMLYPYTDNTLDDPSIPFADKREFCRRLALRLRGQRLAPYLPRESEIFRLITRLEDAWPREKFPEVWLALLAIHDAQIRSLDQQRGNVNSIDRLIAISVEKGGTSVLADGYVAAGRLGPHEVRFMFGYGVFLQLLDDFQDAEGDHEAGHRTLFSVRVGRRTLDRPIGRLLRFIDRVLGGSSRFADPRYDTLKDLIGRNCTLSLLGAAAHCPRLLGRTFRRRLDRTSPLSFRAIRRLRRRSERLVRQIRNRLGSERARDLSGAVFS